VTRLPPAEFAAFIGIDWADAQHDSCLPAAGTAERAWSVLDHQPEVIDEWVRTLRTRFNGQPIAIGLALTRGPIVSALRQHDFLVLFPVNPLPLARDREACTPSQAKDDPTDAELLLALLLNHRDTLQPVQPQSPTMRALEQLVASRRRLVGDKVRRTPRLTSTLKNSFPHALQGFQDNDPTIFCDLLTPWPTLKAAQRARRSTLARFCRAHHGRSTEVLHQRLHAIKRATPLTTDEGGITPNALLVQALVTQLCARLHAIEEFDKAMAQRAQSHPDLPCFDALPGAGAVFAPRLLVAFGEQRARYASADELHKYAGIAPVTARSGTKAWSHWRLQCPTFLRQTCVAWAAEAPRHSFWARASYPQQRDKGASHQAAVRALAFQWIRLRFRCWQNRTPYNASSYLNALARRGSPLLRNLAQTA
jgi:transposase